MLKKLIYDKGYNYHSFSVKCGVPMTTLRTIQERNSIMNTNLHIVIKIAKGLDMTLDEFVEKMQG